MSEVKKQINCYQDDDKTVGTRTLIHPCATQYPKFTDEQCPHCLVQDFEAMDAKHCSPLCKQSGATIPNFVCAVLILLGLIICMAINAQVGAV